jgi:hypothetical protein
VAAEAERMSNVFLDQIVNDNLAAIHPSQSITPLGPKPSRIDHDEDRNISRKDAKVAKKKMAPNLAFLAPWREQHTGFMRYGPLVKIIRPALWGEKYPH